MNLSQLSPIKINLLTAGVGVLTASILLEIGFRLFPASARIDPEPRLYPTEHLNNGYAITLPYLSNSRGYYDQSKGRTEYYFNGLGARVAHMERTVAASSSIIMVGDSLTFGFGLRVEDTYPRLAQERLRSRGIDILLHNFATPGWDAVDAADKYSRVGRLVPHKLLIYGLYLNDLVNFPTRPEASVLAKHPHPFLSYSYLYRFTYKALERIRLRKVIIKKILDQQSLEQELARNNLGAIDRMKALAEKNNAGFLVLILPVFIDLKRYPLAPVHVRLAEELVKRKISYLDVTAALAREKTQNLWILPSDMHPNEVANNIIAEELCNFLIKNYPAVLRHTFARTATAGK